MQIKLAIAACLLAALVGCTSSPKPTQNWPQATFSPVSRQGSAQRGEQLFTTGVNGLPACATCHRTDTVSVVGPGLGGFAARAASRVQGLSAEEYAYQSIITPSRYLVGGFTNVMFDKYGEKLTTQDIADLIAYLMKLN